MTAGRRSAVTDAAVARRREGSAQEQLLPVELLLEQTGLALVATDTRGRLLYVSSYAAALFGVPGDASRMLGKPLLSLGFADDREKVAELLRQALRGRTWEGTLVSARGDGSTVIVRAYAVPLRRSQARPSAPGGVPPGPPAPDGPQDAMAPADGVIIATREARRSGSLRERDTIGLLGRFSERLSGSLELGTTLRHVAEMLVPQYADHCFIDLFHGGTLIRRVEQHAGGWEPPPGTWARVGERIHYPEGHFCQQAMARLDTVVVQDLEQGEPYPAPSPESLRAAKETGLASVIAAPLSARGELLGVMSLALSGLTNRKDRHYGADERDLFGAIAGRIAVAIDNAMLFEAERQTALAFQKSLLPQELPVLDGVDVACRYVPARPLATHGQGIQTQVGGDWYDVIPLAAGRVGIVIGDVEGRGARAAAIMAQLRTALSAFAQDEQAPAEILRKLDTWCRSMASAGPAAGPASPLPGDPPTASCIYLVYDPWSRELSFASAGHAAPLLVTGGEVRQLEIRDKGVLLGVRGKGIEGLPTYKEQALVLPGGATLVLYTDGLTDRRVRADGPGHYTGEEAAGMLREAVRAAGTCGNADAIAHAAEHAVPGDIDDDMAILVVRSLPGRLPSRERAFPAEPVMVSEARSFASETFGEWRMDEAQSELACLLVSELVTNAVLHTAVTPRPGREPGAEAGASPDAAASKSRPAVPQPKNFTVRLRRGASAVWVEVLDPDLRLPRIRTAAEDDEGGRGLYLVEQLATRWGSRPTRDGKAVWFEIPLSGQRP
jgi:PAS domain S-box-containing protein